MLSAVKPPTNKFIPVQYSAINKLTKWQLGMSLSLTSAAALRAAADKLTPFHLTNYDHLSTYTNPCQENDAHENLRRRTGRFALTRLQNRPVPPTRAVSRRVDHFMFCLRISLFREAQFSTVPRASQRSQNRCIFVINHIICYHNDFGFVPLTCA